jgi:ketosteroid isomerase-like protein
MFVRSSSTTSRPALRAAASGGRPRAGSDPTATGRPTSPSPSRVGSTNGDATRDVEADCRPLVSGVGVGEADLYKESSEHRDRDGEREDRTYENRNVLVIHIRNGKLVETWLMSQDQYAADEFFA